MQIICCCHWCCICCILIWCDYCTCNTCIYKISIRFDFCRTGFWCIRCSGIPPVWQLFFIVAGMSILEALFALIFFDIFVLNFLALSLIYSEIWRFSASDIFEKSPPSRVRGLKLRDRTRSPLPHAAPLPRARLAVGH